MMSCVYPPAQKRKSAYKYQAYYAPFIYGLMTINWLLSKDILLLIRYHKKNLLTRQGGLSLSKAITQVTIYKSMYIILFVVAPLIIVPVAWWITILGFLMMHFICGLILALIFQPAHVISETEFVNVKEDNSVENHWAIHQLKTTANFANGNRLFSWCVGGLNHQIEHHLFPQISHIHYSKIAKIIKATAEKYDLTYIHHRTFLDALKSHFALLNELGTGNYDRKIATSN